MQRNSILYCCLVVLAASLWNCSSEKAGSEKAFTTHLSEIAPGWAGNSVNATIFRKNSVVSSANYQFVAFYDSTTHVNIARRKHGTDEWEIKQTRFSGNIRDAHNVISIMVDGEGYLHMSWDHHNNPLHYAKSRAPESLEFGDMEAMAGQNETVVSYPEFYRLGGGDLLFAYRDGGSGNGNLVLNKYSLKEKKWGRLQSNLIDGEGQRNAYWQMCTDKNGCIHLSWVWRETPDVRSNHDMCYARSDDGGITWQKSNNDLYQLPITLTSAEVVKEIPQGSNLINQTSMCTDDDGNPYIATYYRAPGDSCTQFQVIFTKNGEWQSTTATNRTLDFELGGYGSRSIPISRPQLLVLNSEGKKTMALVYRDEEADNNIVLASASLDGALDWQSQIVSPYPVERWEPSYDSELLRRENKFHLYFQKVAQGQAETTVTLPSQMVGVLEIDRK